MNWPFRKYHEARFIAVLFMLLLIGTKFIYEKYFLDKKENDHITFYNFNPDSCYLDTFVCFSNHVDSFLVGTFSEKSVREAKLQPNTKYSHIIDSFGLDYDIYYNDSVKFITFRDNNNFGLLITDYERPILSWIKIIEKVGSYGTTNFYIGEHINKID